MQSVGDYVKSLNKRIKRDAILGDIEDINASVEMLENSVDGIKKLIQSKGGISDKTVKLYVKSLPPTRGRDDDERLDQVSFALTRITQLTDVLPDMVKANMEKEILSDGISYISANLLRLVEVMQFTLHYTELFMVFICNKEAESFSDSNRDITQSLTKNDLRFIDQNINTYSDALKLFLGDIDKMVKSLKAIPDKGVIPDHEDALTAQLGSVQALDPLSLNFVNSSWWPPYHVSLKLAEWQAASIERKRRTLRSLELRRIYLNSLIGGEASPAVEKELKVIDGDIDKINYKLKKYNEAA